MRTLLEDPGLSTYDQAQTIEADHGRIEIREAHLVTDLTWLQEQHHWPGLACFGKITAMRQDKATGVRQG